MSKRHTLWGLALVVSLVCSLSFVACGGKKKVEEEAVPTATEADESGELGDSDAGKALGLQTINFGYDSYLLDSGAKSTLGSNAQVLKDRPSMRIQIEGHCDERGGIQYNLALGEKRAEAVRNYLIDQGVNGDRIETISFGKERPLVSESNEEAWAQNRRANFVVTAR